MKHSRKTAMSMAAVTAMMLAAAPLSANAATGTVPSDTKTVAVTVNNIEGAGEVTAYRVVKPVYNEEGFVRFEKADGVAIADIEHPTAAEATTIAQAILNGTVSPDKAIKMTGSGNTYTASLPAGEYVVLVKNESIRNSVTVGKITPAWMRPWTPMRRTARLSSI